MVGTALANVQRHQYSNRHIFSSCIVSVSLIFFTLYPILSMIKKHPWTDSVLGPRGISLCLRPCFFLSGKMARAHASRRRTWFLARWVTAAAWWRDNPISFSFSDAVTWLERRRTTKHRVRQTAVGTGATEYCEIWLHPRRDARSKEGCVDSP